MSSPYTSPTLTAYNANAPSDDGSTVASNAVQWQKHIDKIGDPLRAYIDEINTNVQAAFTSIHGETSAESAVPVTPVNYHRFADNTAYDIRRFGAVDGDDCRTAIQNMHDAYGFATIPDNFTAKLSTPLNCAAAGRTIRGANRFTSILQPTAGFVGAALIENSNQDVGTSYGLTVSDLCFKLFTTANIDVIGVDLASLNNSTVSRCRFEGLVDATGDFDEYLATGVRFAAPLSTGSYSNSVQDCDFTYMEHGVLYAGGGNHNLVIGGEFIVCKYGAHAAPSSVTDSVYINGSRFEGCDVGILEGSEQSVYIRCRFEANNTADIEFTVNSVDPMIVGGSTATTVTPLKTPENASGLMILAPDLLGAYFRSNSASRAHQFIGPNVFAPLNDAGTDVNPTGAGTVAAYLRGGRLIIDQEEWLGWRNAAGTGVVLGWKVDANDRLHSNAPVGLPTYTVAGLPSAATNANCVIFVSNDVGGPTVAVSDGTNWRRLQDLAVISAT